MEMAAIRPYMMQGLMKGMLDLGLEPSSCNEILMLLRFMFNCAINWELVSDLQNPCLHIEALRLNNRAEN